MRILKILCFISFVAPLATADDELPIVPQGFTIDVIAKEPFVRNPCAMAFDRLGRICIGQGPQYRNPKPDTPGDRVDILIDKDGDGISDGRKTFAEGFNCIQGLAWRGRDLWVANAPDLTIVRDLDGDDVADEYVRVFTDLGNLEHGLHGLNFGPDGMLYMSKGNSRGYNRPDRLAPAPFRELWGLEKPDGAEEGRPQTFTAKTYKRSYHTPADDWGQQGGILRCDPDGSNLQIVSRGFRNPWDIALDDGFNWLGTDNDQTQGDKIFSPFSGANFGWGHSWSYHWTGDGHLPTVPASAKLFEGSGTGVTYFNTPQSPPEYRGVYFINDWLRRETRLFRPKWDGGLMRCDGDSPSLFAHAGGGRSMPLSSGRVYDPTDIEVGPDGALYVLSWGRTYGADVQDGEQRNIGRVYRIRYKDLPLLTWTASHRGKRHAEWTLEELYADLAGHVPTWRVNAQQEFVRRGHGQDEKRVIEFLQRRVLAAKSTREETWGLWTMCQLSGVTTERFTQIATDETASLNKRIQSVRIVAHRLQRSKNRTSSPPMRFPLKVVRLLNHSNARIRHATVLALHRAGRPELMSQLSDLAARETDRIVFYSTWNALRDLASIKQRKQWLENEQPGLRLAALLGLLEDGLLSADQVLPLRSDADQRIASLAESWLQKTGGAEPIVRFDPPPGEYSQPVTVSVSTPVAGSELIYSLDGSTPVKTSPRYRTPLQLNRNSTVRVTVQKDGVRTGPVISGEYTIRHVQPYSPQPFISNVRTASERMYEMDWTGLGPGKRLYVDRKYVITDVPAELAGLPFLQTANNDDRCTGTEFLRLHSASDVTVLLGVDIRIKEQLNWMRVGKPNGFVETQMLLKTSDSHFKIFKRTFQAGEIILGGNTNSAASATPRGNYIVIFDRPLLQPDNIPPSQADVLAALKTADPQRGREIFLHPRGAGCVKCHRMEGYGEKYAPDLSDIGTRMKKPETIIQSILQPSEVITEGFAQQQLVTKQGRVFSGAIIEETGLSLKLIDTNGRPLTIRKQDIEERLTTKISPMPAGFEKLMSAQQLADLVAWLQTQTKVGDRNGFSFRDRPDETEIYFGDQRLMTYVKNHPKLTRRALVNVKTLSGIQVTRQFPAPKGSDHTVMHPGIWIGFGDLNGNDYWRLKSRVRFAGFSGPLVGTSTTADFTTKNDYLTENGRETVCRETTNYRFRRVPQGVLIHIAAEFKSDNHNFYFGDQEESGLAVRVSAPIRVDTGNGTILNDSGDRNGAQVRGKSAKWFDYFGTIGEKRVGLMVTSHAANPKTTWLHARDYGLVATNPFPMQPREQREPYVKTVVRKGEVFRLAWTVLIHEQDAEDVPDREAWYQMAIEELRHASTRQ